MEEWFRGYPPHGQALVAGAFTWLLTALGAFLVVLVKDVGARLLAAMLGFAAGVMLAASFWSLLAPSIELAHGQGVPEWLPALTGFVAGAAVMRGADWLLIHAHPRRHHRRGVDGSWRRSTLLITAVTLHNIPEGLAVGAAFGAAAASGELQAGAATPIGAAIALTVGIGLQNFPEGLAVALPLRAGGLSRWKSFGYGQASGLVEPIAAVVGAYAVVTVRPLLPYALSFAAGAMIFVVLAELVPESQSERRHHDVATFGALFGFCFMMWLDVALA